MDSLNALIEEAEDDMRRQCEIAGHRVVGRGLVSVTVSATLIGCSRSTLRNLAKRGTITPATLDDTGHRMFDLRELARHIAQNRQNAQRLMEDAAARNLLFRSSGDEDD